MVRRKEGGKKRKEEGSSEWACEIGGIRNDEGKGFKEELTGECLRVLPTLPFSFFLGGFVSWTDVKFIFCFYAISLYLVAQVP